MKTTPDALKVLAGSLLPPDRVALEVTGGAWEVARILEPHPQKVIVVSPDDTGIAQARAKTDKLDSRTLARLLASGELAAGASLLKGRPTGVWVTHQKMRAAERQLAEQAEQSYQRSVRDWKAATPKKNVGASATPGHA